MSQYSTGMSKVVNSFDTTSLIAYVSLDTLHFLIWILSTATVNRSVVEQGDLKPYWKDKN